VRSRLAIAMITASTLGVLGVLGRPVVAEPRDPLDPMAVGPTPGKLEKSFSQQIEDRLTWLGEEMDEHFGKLSMDRLAIRVNGRSKTAQISVGKGDGGTLSMRLGGDVKFEKGLAHIDAKIDLTINGHRMHLALPRIDLVPASYQGEHYLEVRLPILRGTFEPEDWFR
jgi:hypothetical protein